MTRILTAAVLLPILWLTLKRGPPWAFHALVLVVLLLAAWECYALLEGRGARPMRWLGMASCVAVALSFLPGSWGGGPGLALFLATFGAATFAMASLPDATAMLTATLATLFPVLFVGLPFGSTIGLRSLPGEDGTDLILLLLVCVMASDTVAYYVGRAFGRRRLAPVVSPNKSWEGALGGLAASVGGGLLAHAWFFQRLPIEHAVLLGILLGVAGIVGDLAESMLKRAAGAKDSAKLLPGHGGFLDRTDSLLFAAPLLYYYAVHVLGIRP
jgi:phosphatidate cytidylyltransferase